MEGQTSRITSPASAGGRPTASSRAGTTSSAPPLEIVANRTANWTNFRNLGNVGIGNGSVATFGDPDSLPSNYSDNYFQAGDVSQEPLDPVRELNLNPAPRVAAMEPGNVSAGNDTAAPLGNSNLFPDAAVRQNFSASRNRQAFNDSSQPAIANASQPSSENATGPAVASTVPSSATPENMTYAAYHPINAGRPVNDLLYEHPFASSISTYCRLVGLATPSGLPVNIGMRCLSYGY